VVLYEGVYPWRNFSLLLIILNYTSNSTTGTPLKGLIELYGKFRRTITLRAYVTGLGLAVEAVENGYEPREVRRRSFEIERETKAKYGWGLEGLWSLMSKVVLIYLLFLDSLMAVVGFDWPVKHATVLTVDGYGLKYVLYYNWMGLSLQLKLSR